VKAYLGKSEKSWGFNPLNPLMTTQNLCRVGIIRGGGSGAPPRSLNVEAYIKSALPYYSGKIKLWMMDFARGWTNFIDTGRKIEPIMVKFAKEWLKTTMEQQGIDPEIVLQRVLPVVSILEKAFAAHPEDIAGFGRCMLRLAEFSIFVGKIDNISYYGEDFFAPLEIFDDPKLVEIGIRLAEVAVAKLRDTLSPRCLIAQLPVEVFNYNATLYQAAVERLAKTPFCMNAFWNSIQTLAEVYAGNPEKFNQGIDILEAFYEKLEEKMLRKTIQGIFFDSDNRLLSSSRFLSSLVKLYANYSREVIEKRKVKSTHIWSEVVVRVKVSANSPDWFSEIIEDLTKKILDLNDKGIDPYNLIDLWNYIDKLDLSKEKHLEKREEAFNLLLGGEEINKIKERLINEIIKESL